MQEQKRLPKKQAMSMGGSDLSKLPPAEVSSELTPRVVAGAKGAVSISKMPIYIKVKQKE